MTTKNKKWFNNGIVQILVESCPEGFIQGRLKMTEEQKQKLSKSHLGQTPWNKNKIGVQKAWNKGQITSTEVKKKIGQANKAVWANKAQEERDLINKKRSTRINDCWLTLSKEARKERGKSISQTKINKSPEIKEQIKTKINNTKKLNHTFNTSNPEENYYKYLCAKYGVENVIRQYSDPRYPFACDFYVKPEDLFIELNLHWTHGEKEFEGSAEDLYKLQEWQKRAETSEFYKNAIETWTVRDPLKATTAKQNNIKYLVLYQIELTKIV